MSFENSPNTKNIRMGTCSVSYNGVDLGYTMGGVEVEVATTTHETKVDQFGDVVANEFIMGRNINVKVPMSEVTIDNLVDVMPGASIVSTGGVKAFGTITITTNPADTEDVTVNGYPLVFAAAAPNDQAGEFLIGADVTETAENMVALINKNLDPLLGRLVASNVAGVVTITYNLYGTAGNAITLVDNTTGDVTLSGATFSGGVASTAERVEISSGTGLSLLDIAGELILHPIALAGADKSEDLVVPLAATPGGMTFAYKYDEERVFNAEFKGYPDSNGLLFMYGDKTAG